MYRIIWGLLLMLLLVSGSAQAETSTCQFTGALATLTIHRAPLTHASQVKAQLPGGTPYAVQSQHGEHFLIAIDHAYGGWADRRSGMLSGDCGNIPVDRTPLSEFPTVCMFTAEVDVPAFWDADMTLPFGYSSISILSGCQSH